MPMWSRNHDVEHGRRDEVTVIKTQAPLRLAALLRWGFKHGREGWDEAESVWRDTLAANEAELPPYTIESYDSFSAQEESENPEVRLRPLRPRCISRH